MGESSRLIFRRVFFTLASVTFTRFLTKSCRSDSPFIKCDRGLVIVSGRSFLFYYRASSRSLNLRYAGSSTGKHIEAIDEVVCLPPAQSFKFCPGIWSTTYLNEIVNETARKVVCTGRGINTVRSLTYTLCYVMHAVRMLGSL